MASFAGAISADEMDAGTAFIVKKLKAMKSGNGRVVKATAYVEKKVKEICLRAMGDLAD